MYNTVSEGINTDVHTFIFQDAVTQEELTLHE